ncbi:hypothetical protein BX600DRAFT_483866 [Xylariales sp. PMI_506]|nr:hypothetical protein BX600DRAFT_483866 [Xylariales sp. PMI_506]
MRLIHTQTFRFHEFVGKAIPPYAILSHTWEEDEVLVHDLSNIQEACKKKGFYKIQKTCEQAQLDGLQWAWVDTCCIDKKSDDLCHWFFRGWTLQELVAPSWLKFYGHPWTFLGHKCDLVSSLSQATGIDARILNHTSTLSSVPAATKMSWARYRMTTRKEDEAYSLLGLFEVNMPLLYGEGRKAFCRLQEHILNATDDHTLV